MGRKANTAVLKGSQKGQKDYSFNDEHDPRLPAQFWYQESDEGLVLFVVFYGLACRWSRCLGCNLPSAMASFEIPFGDLMAQTDALYANPEIRPRLAEIRKIILSNNGSVLDEATFSSTALMYFLAKTNLLVPNLKTLTLETRPEYVDVEELEFISRALKEGNCPTRLEIAIGFEAYSETIRNEQFLKGLSLQAVEDLASKIAPFGFGLKCYFMLKPVVEMSSAEAIADIGLAVEYLDQLARRLEIPINMHLNPTYVARGTVLETAFAEGRFAPPTIKDVIEAALRAEGRMLKLFLGLSDEGLAVAGGSFRESGDEDTVAQLEAFNRTQDFSLLHALIE